MSDAPAGPGDADPVPEVEAVTLRGPRLVLESPPPFEYAAELAAILSDDDGALRHLAVLRKPGGWTTAMARDRIEQRWRSQAKGTMRNWAVVCPWSRTYLAMAGFREIWEDDRRAELGVIVHADYWRRGITTEALALVLGHAFAPRGDDTDPCDTAGMGLVEVFARTKEDNEGMRAWFDVFGWTERGVHVDNDHGTGEWIEYFITAEDWATVGDTLYAPAVRETAGVAFRGDRRLPESLDGEGGVGGGGGGGGGGGKRWPVWPGEVFPEGMSSRDIRAVPVMDCVYPRIFVGNFGAASDRSLLDANAVAAVVNATDSKENVFEDDDNSLTYLRIPVADHIGEDIEPHFGPAVEFAAGALADDDAGTVLIHCSQGISRSTSIALRCMMGLGGGMSLASAFVQLRTAHRRASPLITFFFDLIGAEVVASDGLPPTMTVMQYWIVAASELVPGLCEDEYVAALMAAGRFGDGSDDAGDADVASAWEQVGGGKKRPPVHGDWRFERALDALVGAHSELYRRRVGCSRYHPFD